MRSALGSDFAFRAPSRSAHLAPFAADADPDRVLQGLLGFRWYNAVQPIFQFMLQDVRFLVAVSISISRRF